MISTKKQPIKFKFQYKILKETKMNTSKFTEKKHKSI